MDELDRYKPIAEAISRLFFPHVEVVIHDLRSGTIRHIYHNLSKRKLGDESLLGGIEQCTAKSDLFPPYLKTNWNGSRMKSVSTLLRDGEGKSIGLMCINMDLSRFDEINRFITNFVHAEKEEDGFLFKHDWREKINESVHRLVDKHALKIGQLSRAEKRLLIHHLYREGAFEPKHAAEYIASLLSMARSTIYHYLKDDR